MYVLSTHGWVLQKREMGTKCTTVKEGFTKLAQNNKHGSNCSPSLLIILLSSDGIIDCVTDELILQVHYLSLWKEGGREEREGGRKEGKEGRRREAREGEREEGREGGREGKWKNLSQYICVDQSSRLTSLSNSIMIFCN